MQVPQEDRLKLLRGCPIEIADGIVVYQPPISEMIDGNFFGALWQLCCSAYDMPSLLDDAGIDFMEVDDWTFFRIMCHTCTPEQTRSVLGDLDLSRFKEMEREFKETGKKDIVLYDEESKIIIDEDIYNRFVAILRELIGFSHPGKKAGNNATKKILIMDDRKRRNRRQKSEDNDSLIFDMIVSLVNTEEFSYDYETVFNLTFYQLLKSFTQIQGKKSAVALMQGSMSGFVDTSGISATDMAWTYSDEKYKPKQKKLINNKYTKGK